MKTDERDERARRRWGASGAKDNERRRPKDLLFEAAARGRRPGERKEVTRVRPSVGCSRRRGPHT